MENNLAVVNTTIGTIMIEPNEDSEVSDEALMGMEVTILSDEGEWVKVKTHYNYEGYMRKSHLVIDNEIVEKWSTLKKYIVIKKIIDVLAKPEYQGKRVKVLARGSLLALSGNEDGKWIEVILPNEEKGWVRKETVRDKYRGYKFKEEDLRKRLVNNAIMYLGTQYRWGGKTPFGIDCSGLCSMAYMLEGIIIYRDAKLKEEYMRKITLEEIKPSDLVFFKGHVAMYIGNDKYVHSTGAEGEVVINSLNPLHEDYREDLKKGILEIGTIF